MHPDLAQRPPSGGTAIIAGVSALVGGLIELISAVVWMATSDYPLFAWGFAPAWASFVSAVLMVVDVIAAVLLLIGAIMLLRRGRPGPTIVALGCAGVVGAYVVGVISNVAQFGRFDPGSKIFLELTFGQSAVRSLLGSYVDLPWFLPILLLVFPAVTFLLALLPSTRRWCGAGNHRPTWAPNAQGRPYQHPNVPGHPAAQAQWGNPPMQRPQDGYRPR
ncbi:hypothetical protein [Nocardia sp. NPDC003979]